MKSKSETNIRLLTAAIVAPFAVLCFLSYNSLIGLVSTIVLLCTYEYLKFSMKDKGHQGIRLAITGIITVASLAYGIVLNNMGMINDGARRPELIFALAFISIGSLAVIFTSNAGIAKPMVVNSAFALFYIGFNLSFFYEIFLKFGGAIALMTLTSVWLFDTGAYFTGKKWGRVRISPVYSPKKSLEGAIGGFFTVFAFMLVYQRIFKLLGLYNGELYGITKLLVLAMIVAVFGTVGDIVESSLKRYHGVKDSGNILPGHGGMLDRIDGLLFVAPVFYIFLILLA